MAISPVIPNCVQVRLLSAVNSQLSVNVLNAQVQAGLVVNQALAETLGSSIKASWTAQLGPVMGSTVGLIRVGVRDMRVPNSAEFLDTGAAVAGSAVGDVMPGSVALCITLRTAQAGKSFRGRTYISGFTEANNGPTGVALAAAGTAAVAFLNALKGNLTAAQLTWGVASRPAEGYVVVKTTTHIDGTTSTKTLTTVKQKSGQVTPITSIASRDLAWESQRRRTNSRGQVPTALLEGPVAQAFFT